VHPRLLQRQADLNQYVSVPPGVSFFLDSEASSSLPKSAEKQHPWKVGLPYGVFQEKFKDAWIESPLADVAAGLFSDEVLLRDHYSCLNTPDKALFPLDASLDYIRRLSYLVPDEEIAFRRDVYQAFPEDGGADHASPVSEHQRQMNPISPSYARSIGFVANKICLFTTRQFPACLAGLQADMAHRAQLSSPLTLHLSLLSNVQYVLYWILRQIQMGAGIVRSLLTAFAITTRDATSHKPIHDPLDQFEDSDNEEIVYVFRFVFLFVFIEMFHFIFLRFCLAFADFFILCFLSKSVLSIASLYQSTLFCRLYVAAVLCASHAKNQVQPTFSFSLALDFVIRL